MRSIQQGEPGNEARSAMSNLKVRTCGQEAKYIQDNWPKNQPIISLPSSSKVLKKSLYCIHQTLLLQCVTEVRVWE